MLLTIDVGNTTTAAAIFSGERIVFRNRLPTPAAGAAMLLERLLKRATGDIDAVVCSSVVPRIDSRLKAKVRSLLGLKLRFVSSAMDLGFSLEIDNPRELGADRICGCAGALTLCRPPLLVIDSGTATTFDLMASGGRYIGGCIMPGLELSLRALADHTAKLKKIAFRLPTKSAGTNTADQIRAGIYHGLLGAVVHLIGEYKKILGSKTVVIATGGLGRILCNRVTDIDRYEPDLIFYGLRHLALRNP